MEEWRDIPGFDGYQASTEGRIRSVDREWQQFSKNGSLHRHRKIGKVLRPAPLRSGHLALVPGRKNGTQTVHSLVALAFHGPRPDGMEVMHLDECCTNNRPTNLQYGTRSENLTRCWAAGSRTVHENFIGARWR